MASQALAAPVSQTIESAELAMPSVLVVDGDAKVVGHCAAMLTELGYPHHGVTSSREALELIARNPAIQIVLACVEMPGSGGFALIEEARVRVGDRRPVAAIVLTERPTAEIAIRSLHLEAVDLLSKPLSFDDYSSALRRAMRYLSARAPTASPAALNGFGEQLTRLVAALETKNGEAAAEGPVTDQQIAATLRLIIASRGMRGRYFPSELFADPAWDILLDLTRAALEKQQVSVSSVCIAASVPMSTALRWVRQMTEAGMLRRWTDPKDRRRDLIALTEQTATHMREYLAHVHNQLRKM